MPSASSKSVGWTCEMPSTAVGLFKDRDLADQVIREIEGLGFSRNEVRRVEEPHHFEVSGVMSFPRLDFETQLERGLKDHYTI